MSIFRCQLYATILTVSVPEFSLYGGCFTALTPTVGKKQILNETTLESNEYTQTRIKIAEVSVVSESD